MIFYDLYNGFFYFVNRSMTVLKYYSYVVIANVVLSWLVAFNVINTSNRFVYSVLDFTYRMTEPFLKRIRRRLGRQRDLVGFMGRGASCGGRSR